MGPTSGAVTRPRVVSGVGQALADPEGPCPRRRCDHQAVPVLRSSVHVVAPLPTVAGLLRDGTVAATALARHGHRFVAPSRLLAAGDHVRVSVRLMPGIRVPVRTRVIDVSTSGLLTERVGGAAPELRHAVTLTATPTGTLVLDELAWRSPFGVLGHLGDRLLVRRMVRRLLAARADELVRGAAAIAAGPVVVATALVRDGHVLAAQRTRPPGLAGRWELPGGRVELGESEPDAVVRECREELGCLVRVCGRLGPDLPLDVGVLRVYHAELVTGSASPRALEHSSLRWVPPDALTGVDWVDADRAVLGDLSDLLVGLDSRPSADREPGVTVSRE
jgi:8-oxo-dGTP diphosphatase